MAVTSSDNEQAALQWQVGVWDRMSPIYLREVDDRFMEIIDAVIRRGGCRGVSMSSTSVPEQARWQSKRPPRCYPAVLSLRWTSAAKCSGLLGSGPCRWA